MTAPDERESLQLAALADVGAALDHAGIEHWVFGGWAVDFYAGRVTRPHDDIDVAVWLDDLPRIRALLERGGWSHAPEPDEDGGTGYERGPVRLELTFLVRANDGRVFIPLHDFEARWPDDALAGDDRELRGVRARVVGLASLLRGKGSARDDAHEKAKDDADFAVLRGLGSD